jgi:SAM-dependent methyltransferase
MKDAIHEYYEKTGAGYRMSSTRRDRVFTLLDAAIEAFPKGEQLRVMDIGIGSGEVARHCRERFPDRDLTLVGVDISENLLAAHRDLYDFTRAVNVDASHWTEAFPEPVHVVVASELIEHLFRPDLFLEALSGVMASGGRLIVTTPNMLLWSRRIKYLLGRHTYADGGVDEWGHIRLFTWPFLKRQLSEHGLRIVTTSHLLHPFFLDRWRQWLPPGLFAFQFVVLAEKK